MSLGVLTFLLVAALSFLKQGHDLDNYTLDWCYRFRPAKPTTPHLLIVGIDEASFQELRLTWPWPRRLHAELINRLNAAGARLIVFDVIFADQTNRQDDHLFTQAIRDSGKVILGQTMELAEETRILRQTLVQPYEPLRRAALGIGLTLISPDFDGVVRRFHLNLFEQPSLPELVVQHLAPGQKLPYKFTGLIEFAGQVGDIDTVSYYQALSKDYPIPASLVRGRIVLVGRTSGASPNPSADTFYSPFFPETGKLMAGVEIQGHIIHTLLQHSWGQEVDLKVRLAIYLIVILLFSLLIARLSLRGAFGIMAGFVLLVGGLSFLMFWQKNLWVPPPMPIIGIIVVFLGQFFTQFLFESREKTRLRHAFGHYVSPSLVEAILENPDQLKLGGEEREVTILFTDLVDFSTLSENRAPGEVIKLLYDYFSSLTDIILSFNGTLDKYIGDAIMAFWGAPLPQEKHASLACHAALAMQREMHRLRQVWQAKGWPVISARLGINSGTVIAGNVGSKTRFNYTVMGPAVNLAYRLEGTNRHFGTEIIISETTYRQLADDFLVRELDLVKVKGPEHPVVIFELLGHIPPGGVPPWVELFAKGRQAYLNRQWHQAIGYFQKVLDLHETDAPAQLYLKRCLRYSHNPPPKGWDGVRSFEKK